MFCAALAAVSAAATRTVRTAPRTDAPSGPPRTCDRSAFGCIYSRVTTSLFDLEVPQSLIDRAKAGELGAFERIYRRFERPVYTLAARVLNDTEAAREVLHDAMLKVFQRIGQYRNDAPFWAWLRQIVMNEALMRLRRTRRFEPEADVELIADDAAPPWVRADALALERALGELPDVTRSVLWLFHVEGYSHPEIADMLGKTTSFSKSQVARGTARLRALLDPAGTDAGSPPPNALQRPPHPDEAQHARFAASSSESVSCLIESSPIQSAAAT